jgi:gliding motility-associated-like protein
VIPNVSPIADTAQLCVGNELSFSNNASLGLPPYVYTIYLDNDNVMRKTNETVKGIRSGYTTVYFNVKDMNGCVSVNSDAFKIKVSDPVVAQKFNYQAYYQEDFVIPTKKDTFYVSYNWTPPNNLNFVNKPDPTFNGENPADYVLVRTDTITKCAVADNYHIDVTRDFILELPNAFTPNNDGLNDEIKVVANAGIKDELIVNIYNRSGKLIHQLLRKTEAWDGKLNQVIQDADVYYWIADYETKTGQKRKKTGSFLLIK